MREPITQYPIVMNVQEDSMTEEKSLNKFSTVKCLRCGKKFMVHENNAFMVAEDVPALVCPDCGYTASVLYYYPKKGGKQFARYTIF